MFWLFAKWKKLKIEIATGELWVNAKEYCISNRSSQSSRTKTQVKRRKQNTNGTTANWKHKKIETRKTTRIYFALTTIHHTAHTLSHLIFDADRLYDLIHGSFAETMKTWKTAKKPKTYAQVSFSPGPFRSHYMCAQTRACVSISIDMHKMYIFMYTTYAFYV